MINAQPKTRFTYQDKVSNVRFRAEVMLTQRSRLPQFCCAVELLTCTCTCTCS